MTALGLVHVVGGHEHRDALGCQRMDFIPEGAARLGIDAGRRLIEQQQLGLVQNAGRQCQPLLPAARQPSRQLVLTRGKAEALERGIDHLAEIAQAVKPADELEVLADGEVFVETKALRHVASLRLDRVTLGDDVMPEAAALAAIRRE